ncbi:hypothetical protein [Streptomyces chattanoogensis]|uniref:hypothetical protein n=1 Tax=Streptomyces chattanoogensis TaxID=66876 RepID=UPI0036CC06F0
MIRIITTARLSGLKQDRDEAHSRAQEILEAADAAYARHVQACWELTEEAESAGRDAQAARARAAELTKALEQTQAELAQTRDTVAKQGTRLMELHKDLEAVCGSVALLRFGQLHSIHPSNEAAKAHAESFDATPDGWVSASDKPASELLWRVVELGEFAVGDWGDDR